MGDHPSSHAQSHSLFIFDAVMMLSTINDSFIYVNTKLIIILG
jgi:hypothetical protein